MQKRIASAPLNENPAFIRAALRVLAYEKGAKIENVVCSEKSLSGLTRWCRQLWAESEGKQGKGIWVSNGFYTEDAHSIGQMISGGERNIIETFISIKNTSIAIEIPKDEENYDGLDHLENKDISFINDCAMLGLKYDHYKSGVPISEYVFPEINALTLGEFYQCEMNACLITCMMQGINGVTQPDVEGYKKAMFALSGKSGYEELKKEIIASFE